MKKNLFKGSMTKDLKFSIATGLNCIKFNSMFLKSKALAAFATVFLVAFSFTFNKVQAQCSSVTYANATTSFGCGIDYISNVTFVGINRNSGCDTQPLLVTTPNPVLTMGNTYTISVTTDGDVEGIRAWIDYNIDGVFSNAGSELIMGPSYQGVVPATYTASVTIPLTATAGGTRLRVRCTWATTPPDATTNLSYGEAEDYCVTIVPSVPCSGIPGANSIVVPGFPICPNTSTGLQLATNYTVGGLTYLWQSSTSSSVGPFVTVPGATANAVQTSTLGTSTWYQAVITCTNGGGTFTAPASQVLVQNTTTNTVPYDEGFEGIPSANKLPNCSWVAPTLGSTDLTYVTSNTLGRTPHTGTSFASFYYSPGGTNYFYTNGIWLDANVTYSASMWFQTEYYGYNNWTDLSILLGTTQTATGLVSIASTNGPAISNVYRSLSNTFSVPTSGIYYVAIRGTGTTSSYADYLSWDDLSISIPCALNTPTVNIIANNTSICEGQAVSLTAAGADTYTWNTGDNNAAINPVPLQVGLNTFVVNGTSALTGCSVSVSQSVFVNPAPDIYISANNPVVCAGKPVVLTALGASTYSWNTGGNSPYTTVMPTTGTSYTVLGSNSYGCTSSASFSVSVNNLPGVGASASRQNICSGESLELTGTGADTYEWQSSSNFVLIGSPITVFPSASGAYTVTGMDVNGCTANAVVTIGVDACTGISQYAGANGVRVYPNPNNGSFVVEMNDQQLKTVEVTDMMGRLIATTNSSADKIDMDLRAVSNGIYYVKVKTDSTVEVIKIVKE
jgi:hypothetical protein